jgi:hypothetical protein
MPDIFWVALISAGGAIAAAALTQFLSTRSARLQGERAERREEVVYQRAEFARQRDARRQALDSLMKEIEAVQMALVSYRTDQDVPTTSEHPGACAMRAHRIAALQLPELILYTEAFYSATTELHDARLKQSVLKELYGRWSSSTSSLTDAVAKLSAVNMGYEKEVTNKGVILRLKPGVSSGEDVDSKTIGELFEDISFMGIKAQDSANTDADSKPRGVTGDKISFYRSKEQDEGVHTDWPPPSSKAKQ